MVGNERKMIYNLIHLFKTTLSALERSDRLDHKKRQEVIKRIQKSSVEALALFIEFFSIDMDELEKHVEYIESDLDYKQAHEKIQ